MSTLAVEFNTEKYAKIRKYVYVRVTFKECSKYYNSARSTKIKIKKSRCEERGQNSRAIISLSNYNCQRSGLSSQTTCHNELKQKNSVIQPELLTPRKPALLEPHFCCKLENCTALCVMRIYWHSTEITVQYTTSHKQPALYLLSLICRQPGEATVKKRDFSNDKLLKQEASKSNWMFD